MPDRSAPKRWWRSFASVAHRLLVGPEPADTPVNGLLALLPRRWRRLLVLAGALLLVVLGAADWAELDRHTALHRLLPVGLLAVAHVAPVAMARRRPLLAWRISVLATVLTPAVAPLEVSSGLPWPPVVGVAHLLVLVQVAAAVPRGVTVLATVVDGAAMAAITVASTTPDLGLVQGDSCSSSWWRGWASASAPGRRPAVGSPSSAAGSSRSRNAVRSWRSATGSPASSTTWSRTTCR